MSGSSRLQGGELNAAVTSALVGIQTEQTGRGPRTASTFHHGNVVVTLMYDVMTPMERSLGRKGHADAVAGMRLLMQETMRAEFGDAIERLTGRKVTAFISGNGVEPDVASEVFILDGEL